MWKFFLIGQNRSTNQRSGMILEVQIQIFGVRTSARRSKFSFSKNSRGPKYLYFLMKIGMELPFALKNKRRNTNLRLDFLKVPPKKCVFGFCRKPPQNLFSSCFGFDSALKTIKAHMFFWLVFLGQFLKNNLVGQYF